MLDRITELRAQYRNKLLKKYALGGPTPSWQNSSMKEVEDRSAFMNNFLNEEDQATKESLNLPKDSTIIPGSQTNTTGAGDGNNDVSLWTTLTNPQSWRNPFTKVDMGPEGSVQGLKPAVTSNVTSNTGQPTTAPDNFVPGQVRNANGSLNLDGLELKPRGLADTGLYKPEDLKLKTNSEVEDKKQSELDRLQQLQLMLGAPGGDAATSFYNAGRAFGMKKGTKGRGLLGAASLSKGFFDVMRNAASGYTGQLAQQYTDKNTRDQLLKGQNQYTAADQYNNTNTIGGQSFRNGGFFRYEDGGENEEELMQMADNGNPGEMQQQQEGNPQQEEKIIQIAQELVNGLGSLEAIDAYLREQKVDEQMYGMIMQVAEQMLGESEQEQDQGQEMPEEGQEQPEMNEGGEFNKNVGDFIEFEYEGKKYSGKISKIENGQIYL